MLESATAAVRPHRRVVAGATGAAGVPAAIPLPEGGHLTYGRGAMHGGWMTHGHDWFWPMGGMMSLR